jgi:hypothetical protein
MSTPAKTQFLSEILSNDDPIPPGKIAFFRERFRDHLYDLVLSEFLKREGDGLTKATIAKRIGRKPEQITRWLGAPGNWTVETVSDLLLAISKAEPTVSLRPLDNRPRANKAEPEWIEPSPNPKIRKFDAVPTGGEIKAPKPEPAKARTA